MQKNKLFIAVVLCFFMYEAENFWDTPCICASLNADEFELPFLLYWLGLLGISRVIVRLEVRVSVKTRILAMMLIIANWRLFMYSFGANPTFLPCSS